MKWLPKVTGPEFELGESLTAKFILRAFRGLLSHQVTPLPQGGGTKGRQCLLGVGNEVVFVFESLSPLRPHR